MIEIFAASGFCPFAAIFPGLAYATAFCEEYSSGYLKMIYSRMSPVKFGLTRIVTTALSGGVMLAISIFHSNEHSLLLWCSRNSNRK